MAWEEVQVDESAPVGARYVKFDAIGKKCVGRFVKVEKRQLTGFARESNIYTLKDKDGEFEVTGTYDLDRRIAAAKLERGNAVSIEYVRDVPPTQPGQSPMKMFKVLVERTSAPSAAPKPDPTRMPPPVDDIPF